jgi:hypothetical protein
MHAGEVEEADDAFKQMESTIGQFTQNTATKDQQINNLMHQCEAQRQQMAMMNQQQQQPPPMMMYQMPPNQANMMQQYPAPQQPAWAKKRKPRKPKSTYGQWTGNGGNNNGGGYKQTKGPDPFVNVKSHPGNNYCWTHGHDMNHNSSQCERQVQGHMVGATKANMMGGNPHNINRNIEPQQAGKQANWRVTEMKAQKAAKAQYGNQQPMQNQFNGMMMQQPPMQQQMQQQYQQPPMQQQQQQQQQFGGMMMQQPQQFQQQQQRQWNPYGQNF